MSVNLLLITHKNIGKALLETAEAMFDGCPLPTTVVAVDYDTSPDVIFDQLKTIAAKLSLEQELLILTDLLGATPHNLASKLCHPNNIRLITGLNLPMLVRAMNYPELTLKQLADKALSGGRDGVVNWERSSKIA